MDLLRGLEAPAWIVGLARGAAEAAAFAALYFLADGLLPVLPGELQWAGPIALLLVRPVEGVLDHIDPAKRSARA